MKKYKLTDNQFAIIHKFFGGYVFWRGAPGNYQVMLSDKWAREFELIKPLEI